MPVIRNDGTTVTKNIRIPYDDLITSLDQLALWGHLIGVSDFKTRIRSPFREDDNPNCYLVEFNGIVKFCDPSRREYKSAYDILSFRNPHWTSGRIMEEIRNLSALGRPKSLFDNRVELDKKKSPKFETYKGCAWSEPHLNFWAEIGVSLSQLSHPETLVTPIRGYSVSDEESCTHFEAFGFLYHINGYIKRYCPFEQKGFKKFGGKVPASSFWHLTKSRNAGTLLIAKSNKDFLVWENLCRASLCCFGSENTYPPDLIKVLEPYDKIILSYDPDPGGDIGVSIFNELAGAYCKAQGKEVIDFRWPDPVTKDISAHYRKYGRDKTISLIKQNFV